MDATALMWPVFSAMRTITTGTMRKIGRMLKCGVLKCGSPTHAADLTAVKLI